ncbi:unnamed protein product [Dicrocoelium dendriticum]|nr:unnamed protein product [Dicrocoelium dendriticum]
MRFGRGTLGNVFLFLAFIACYWVFNFCDGIERMYVYYPLSWTASRRLFGFPPHFRYFHLPTFADWYVDDPTWLAWKKISTANYEVPLYVQEGRWIPNAFKMLCVPAAVSKKFEDMVYAFTMEDFGKDLGDSVRKDFTVYGQYNELGYFYILSLLLNLCACLRNEQPERFCPNPCRAPDPCGNVSHTTGVCIPQRVKRTPDSIPPKLRGKLHDVYNQDFVCGCLKGYEFNRTAKQCVPLRLGCSKTDCYNGGVCETLSFGDDSPSGMSYTCHCPPAWQGYLCEEPRNPCNLDHGLCHPYRCVRDSRNLVNGYACVCPTGTRSGGHMQPQCVNINECNFEANPCLNGGLCVDLDPNDIRSIARPQDHPVGYDGGSVGPLETIVNYLTHTSGLRPTTAHLTYITGQWRQHPSSTIHGTCC